MTRRRRIAELEQQLAHKDDVIRRMAGVIGRQEIRIEALKAERDAQATRAAKAESKCTDHPKETNA